AADGSDGINQGIRHHIACFHQGIHGQTQGNPTAGDGGTRCASITGGWVALRLAAQKLVDAGDLAENPISTPVAAISCGVYAGQVVLDLDYAEDSEAGTDANVVMTGAGGLVEVQASAEGATFSRAEMTEMLDLAAKGVGELAAAQREAAGG
ncbi:MAG: ribonuclease PH, partial [Pseudomonadota bacterium]